MRIIIRFLLSFICVFLMSLELLFAQVEGPCAESLEKANNEFEAGHFYEIPGILRNCLEKKDFSREQRIQAYYLLTRTYLFLDRADSAEISFLKLLKEDPEYKVTEENDPIDMVYLSENFITTPVFSLKAGGGPNLTFIRMIDALYGTDNSENSHEVYRIKWAYHLNGGVELHFSNTLSMEADLMLNAKRYHYQNKYFGEIPQDPENRTYTALLVEAPIFMKYTFERDKIRPYVFTGYQVGMRLFETGNHHFNNIEKQPGDDKPSSIPSETNLNLTKFRSLVNHFLIGGIGAYYKINYNAIFMEIRFAAGLNKWVTARYSADDFQNETPPVSYHYDLIPGHGTAKAEDDYSLNTVMINIGYVWPLYKPRKKDEKTLRDLFSK